MPFATIVVRMIICMKKNMKNRRKPWRNHLDENHLGEFPTITLRATFTFLVEALIDKDNVTSKLIATVLMQFCFMIS